MITTYYTPGGKKIVPCNVSVIDDVNLTKPHGLHERPTKILTTPS